MEGTNTDSSEMLTMMDIWTVKVQFPPRCTLTTIVTYGSCFLIGGVYFEDPRLGPLPPNWTRDSDWDEVLTSLYTPYMDADTIKKVL